MINLHNERSDDVVIVLLLTILIYRISHGKLHIIVVVLFLVLHHHLQRQWFYSCTVKCLPISQLFFTPFTRWLAATSPSSPSLPLAHIEFLSFWVNTWYANGIIFYKKIFFFRIIIIGCHICSARETNAALSPHCMLHACGFTWILLKTNDLPNTQQNNFK